MIRDKITPERLQAMQAGIAELQQRLLDIIRAGLISLHTPPQYFSDFAARMVDAQLGSIGKRIRTWIVYYETKPKDWYDYLLAEMGSLYIFSKAFQKLDTLDEVWQDELLQQAGVSLKKNDLIEQVGIMDDWLVLGQIETAEVDNLTSRRAYLIGKKSRKYLLVLDYTFGNQLFPTLWLNGQAYMGEAVFYPATYPLRAVFKTTELAEPFSEVVGYQSIVAMFDDYAKALAQNPWLPQFPVLLDRLRPVFRDVNLIFVDSSKNRLYTEGGDSYQIWEILKPLADLPMQVFGEWNGQQFLPLSAFIGGNYLSLQIEKKGQERFLNDW